MTRPNGVLFCSPARWSGNGVPGAGASLSVFEETLCVVLLRQLPTCGLLGIAKKVLGRFGLHHDWRWNVIVQYHFPILSVVLLVGVLEPPMVLVLVCAALLVKACRKLFRMFALAAQGNSAFRILKASSLVFPTRTSQAARCG